MSRHLPAVRAVLSLVVLLLLASSCAVDGLSFRRDDRFSWVAPDDGDVVTLPFVLDWEMEDFDGYFAVFFDQSPMAPKETLLDLVPSDDPCRDEPTCPDTEWLGDEDIFVTADTELLVEDVRDRSGRRSDRDPHEITIVLLDETGTRLAETVFIREIIIDRSEDR